MDKMHSEFITWLRKLAEVRGQEALGKEREYWTVWQAAQSVPAALPADIATLGWQMIQCPICGEGAQGYPKPDIPVVGEPVGYLTGGTLMRRKLQGYDNKPLIVQPANAITAAELSRLQRIESVMIQVSNLRFDHTTLPMIREMIDAAIAGEKK